MDCKLLAPVVLATALAVAPGCIIVTEPAPSVGTLTVRWAIEGSTDPLACSTHGAVWARLVITAADGDTEATLTPSCTAFVTSVGLYAGWHRMAMTMLDGAGRPISTSVVTPVEVWFDRTSTVVAEFPASSFLQRAD